MLTKQMNMLMRRIEAMWITGSSVCRDMDNWLQCFTFQLESLYCILTMFYWDWIAWISLDLKSCCLKYRNVNKLEICLHAAMYLSLNQIHVYVIDTTALNMCWVRFRFRSTKDMCCHPQEAITTSHMPIYLLFQFFLCPGKKTTK